MPTSETKKHSTPCGGDRSAIYYQDKNGNPVDKSKAVRAEIVEYKGEQVVGRTYGELGADK